MANVTREMQCHGDMGNGNNDELHVMDLADDPDSVDHHYWSKPGNGATHPEGRQTSVLINAGFHAKSKHNRQRFKKPTNRQHVSHKVNNG